MSPVGTIESGVNFNRPYGTLVKKTFLIPSTQVLGYSQMSLTGQKRHYFSISFLDFNAACL